MTLLSVRNKPEAKCHYSRDIKSAVKRIHHTNTNTKHSLWPVGAGHRHQEKLNNMNIEKEGIKMFMSWLETIDKNFQWQISNCQSHVKKQIIMYAQDALRDTFEVFADELEGE